MSKIDLSGPAKIEDLNEDIERLAGDRDVAEAARAYLKELAVSGSQPLSYAELAEAVDKKQALIASVDEIRGRLKRVILSTIEQAPQITSFHALRLALEEMLLLPDLDRTLAIKVRLMLPGAEFFGEAKTKTFYRTIPAALDFVYNLNVEHPTNIRDAWMTAFTRVRDRVHARLKAEGFPEQIYSSDAESVGAGNRQVEVQSDTSAPLVTSDTDADAVQRSDARTLQLRPPFADFNQVRKVCEQATRLLVRQVPLNPEPTSPSARLNAVLQLVHQSVWASESKLPTVSTSARMAMVVCDGNAGASALSKENLLCRTGELTLNKGRRVPSVLLSMSSASKRARALAVVDAAARIDQRLRRPNDEAMEMAVASVLHSHAVNLFSGGKIGALLAEVVARQNLRVAADAERFFKTDSPALRAIVPALHDAIFDEPCQSVEEQHQRTYAVLSCAGLMQMPDSPSMGLGDIAAVASKPGRGMPEHAQTLVHDILWAESITEAVPLRNALAGSILSDRTVAIMTEVCGMEIGTPLAPPATITTWQQVNDHIALVRGTAQQFFGALGIADGAQRLEVALEALLADLRATHTLVGTPPAKLPTVVTPAQRGLTMEVLAGAPSEMGGQLLGNTTILSVPNVFQGTAASSMGAFGKLAPGMGVRQKDSLPTSFPGNTLSARTRDVIVRTIGGTANTTIAPPMEVATWQEVLEYVSRMQGDGLTVLRTRFFSSADDARYQTEADRLADELWRMVVSMTSEFTLRGDIPTALLPPARMNNDALVRTLGADRVSLPPEMQQPQTAEVTQAGFQAMVGEEIRATDIAAFPGTTRPLIEGLAAQMANLSPKMTPLLRAPLRTREEIVAAVTQLREDFGVIGASVTASLQMLSRMQIVNQLLDQAADRIERRCLALLPAQQEVMAGCVIPRSEILDILVDADQRADTELEKQIRLQFSVPGGMGIGGSSEGLRAVFKQILPALCYDPVRSIGDLSCLLHWVQGRLQAINALQSPDLPSTPNTTKLMALTRSINIQEYDVAIRRLCGRFINPVPPELSVGSPAMSQVLVGYEPQNGRTVDREEALRVICDGIDAAEADIVAMCNGNVPAQATMRRFLTAAKSQLRRHVETWSPAQLQSSGQMFYIGGYFTELIHISTAWLQTTTAYTPDRDRRIRTRLEQIGKATAPLSASLDPLVIPGTGRVVASTPIAINAAPAGPSIEHARWKALLVQPVKAMVQATADHLEEFKLAPCYADLEQALGDIAQQIGRDLGAVKAPISSTAVLRPVLTKWQQQLQQDTLPRVGAIVGLPSAREICHSYRVALGSIRKAVHTELGGAPEVLSQADTLAVIDAAHKTVLTKQAFPGGRPELVPVLAAVEEARRRRPETIASWADYDALVRTRFAELDAYESKVDAPYKPFANDMRCRWGAETVALYDHLVVHCTFPGASEALPIAQRWAEFKPDCLHTMQVNAYLNDRQSALRDQLLEAFKKVMGKVVAQNHNLLRTTGDVARYRAVLEDEIRQVKNAGLRGRLQTWFAQQWDELSGILSTSYALTAGVRSNGGKGPIELVSAETFLADLPAAESIAWPDGYALGEGEARLINPNHVTKRLKSAIGAAAASGVQIVEDELVLPLCIEFARTVRAANDRALLAGPIRTVAGLRELLALYGGCVETTLAAMPIDRVTHAELQRYHPQVIAQARTHFTAFIHEWRAGVLAHMTVTAAPQTGDTTVADTGAVEADVTSVNEDPLSKTIVTTTAGHVGTNTAEPARVPRVIRRRSALPIVSNDADFAAALKARGGTDAIVTGLMDLVRTVTENDALIGRMEAILRSAVPTGTTDVGVIRDRLLLCLRSFGRHALEARGVTNDIIPILEAVTTVSAFVALLPSPVIAPVVDLTIHGASGMLTFTEVRTDVGIVGTNEFPDAAATDDPIHVTHVTGVTDADPTGTAGLTTGFEVVVTDQTPTGAITEQEDVLVFQPDAKPFVLGPSGTNEASADITVLREPSDLLALLRSRHGSFDADSHAGIVARVIRHVAAVSRNSMSPPVLDALYAAAEEAATDLLGGDAVDFGTLKTRLSGAMIAFTDTRPEADEMVDEVDAVLSAIGTPAEFLLLLERVRVEELSDQPANVADEVPDTVVPSVPVIHLPPVPVAQAPRTATFLDQALLTAGERQLALDDFEAQIRQLVASAEVRPQNERALKIVARVQNQLRTVASAAPQNAEVHAGAILRVTMLMELAQKILQDLIISPNGDAERE